MRFFFSKTFKIQFQWQNCQKLKLHIIALMHNFPSEYIDAQLITVIRRLSENRFHYAISWSLANERVQRWEAHSLRTLFIMRCYLYKTSKLIACDNRHRQFLFVYKGFLNTNNFLSSFVFISNSSNKKQS